MKQRIKIILLLVLLITFSSVVIADEDDVHIEDENHDDLSLTDWLGHAIFSMVSLVMLILIMILGWMSRGKLPKNKIKNSYKKHKILSLLFFLIVLATFIYGIWITSRHNIIILNSSHGFIGLILVIVSFFSMILSPIVTKREIGKKLHTIDGLLILLILVLMIILGINNII